MASKELTVALVGAGQLGRFLAPALTEAGYRISEILTRKHAGSRDQARALARRVGARAVTMESAALDAEVLWFAVPDREIRRVAELLAQHGTSFNVRSSSAKSRGKRISQLRYAFHSSGALGSRELKPLRQAGWAVASVHPLMTFVPGTRPSLAGVPFAIEGDGAAVRVARAIVCALGAKSFVLAARRKPAYHAWGTMTSPLLLAYLVTIEKVAREAGLGREEARRMSMPILRQTLENYAQRGPGNSFSGPYIRGDAGTVATHLALLKHNPKTYAVYVALARMALDELPVKNRNELRRLLEDNC